MSIYQRMLSVTSIPTDYSVNLTTVLLSLTYHVFPVVLSGSLLLTGNGNRLMFHLYNLSLLRVQNDIIHAVDSEVGAILTLLDLSAAFDTIDHQKLMDLLYHSFGISGDTLRWFKSYLQERIQMVQIGSSTSEPVTLKYGVPQGSVLGPILFTMYTHSTW